MTKAMIRVQYLYAAGGAVLSDVLITLVHCISS